MFPRIAPVASAALLAFSIWAEPSLAAPGDTVVPAHRTRSGAYVPASVPPMSPGPRLAPPPSKGSKAPLAQDQSATTFLIPLFADARPIRR
jgi:hypothetical protein